MIIVYLKSNRVLFAAALLSYLVATAALAQHHAGVHSPDQDSTFEDATKRMPAPKIMDGIGDSNLRVTTASEEAQIYFDQGLRLLHCFWDFEALRAFREAVRLDPQMAMGYWGIYKAIGYNRFLAEEKKQALVRAAALSENASDYERRLIAAYEALEDPEQGKKIFVRQIEALIDDYPQDIEARLFFALQIMSGYDSGGNPKEYQIYSQQILANLLTTHPRSSAAHHYWIHGDGRFVASRNGS